MTHREADGEAEIHDSQADIFLAQSGQATVVTGGQLEGPRVVAPEGMCGTAIRAGLKRTAHPGDLLDVAAKTLHEVHLPPGRRLTYRVLQVNVPQPQRARQAGELTGGLRRDPRRWGDSQTSKSSARRADKAHVPSYLQLFLYLQVLDFLTTVVGLRLGLVEVSPFIRWLMGGGTVLGALIAKLGAVALAGFCLWIQRRRLIQWVNYWYAALVVWNLSMIWVALSRA